MSENKPETPAEWAAYRCQASCRIARDVLDGVDDMPPGSVATISEYAIYNLLHAVEDLSKQVAELMKP